MSQFANSHLPIALSTPSLLQKYDFSKILEGTLIFLDNTWTTLVTSEGVKLICTDRTHHLRAIWSKFHAKVQNYAWKIGIFGDFWEQNFSSWSVKPQFPPIFLYFCINYYRNACSNPEKQFGNNIIHQNAKNLEIYGKKRKNSKDLKIC